MCVLCSKSDCVFWTYLCIHVHLYCLCGIYFMHGYFHGGFIFVNFASQTSPQFSLQFTCMSIYSNENIRKFLKLSPREFPHLVQNRKNICTRKVWRIQYFVLLAPLISQLYLDLHNTHFSFILI